MLILLDKMEAITKSSIFSSISESFLTHWNVTTNISKEAYNLTNITISQAPVQDVSIYYPIMSAVMLLSCLCLTLSIAVYAVLPEFNNVHGKNLISMSGCLLISYVMTILDFTLRIFLSFPVCLLISVVMHLSFLAYFFWTNVMAFDIWKSLTDMKTKGEVKDSSKKYLKYSVYAWMATLLTATPAGVLELTDLLPLEDRPRFGIQMCWLSGEAAFIYYFELPMGVILFCNLCMFLLTLRNLNAIKKMTAVLNVKQHQKRLNLYMKLFLVMGITWAVLFVPWMTGTFRLYALAGSLTGMQGIFLFVIFVCKKKTLFNFYHYLRSSGNKKTKKASTASNTTSQTVFYISNDINCSLDKLCDSKF